MSSCGGDLQKKEFLVVPLWEVASGTQFLGYCDLGRGWWGAQTRPRAVSPPELFYSCPDVPNPPGGHRSQPRSPPFPLELWGPLGWWPLVPGSLRPPSGGPRPGAGGRSSPWGHPPPSAGSWREEEEEEEGHGTPRGEWLRVSIQPITELVLLPALPSIHPSMQALNMNLFTAEVVHHCPASIH